MLKIGWQVFSVVTPKGEIRVKNKDSCRIIVERIIVKISANITKIIIIRMIPNVMSGSDPLPVPYYL